MYWSRSATRRLPPSSGTKKYHHDSQNSILSFSLDKRMGDEMTALLWEYYGALTRVQHIQRRLIRTSYQVRNRGFWLAKHYCFGVLEWRPLTTRGWHVWHVVFTNKPAKNKPSTIKLEVYSTVYLFIYQRTSKRTHTMPTDWNWNDSCQWKQRIWMLVQTLRISILWWYIKQEDSSCFMQNCYRDRHNTRGIFSIRNNRPKGLYTGFHHIWVESS